MVRKLRGPESQKSGKVKRFLRYSTLLAGLAAGCQPHTGGQCKCRIPAPTFTQEMCLAAKPLPITNGDAVFGCDKSGGLAVGQEIWRDSSGSNGRGLMTRIKIRALNGDKAVVDLSLPNLSSEYSKNVNLILTYKGVTVKRAPIERFVKAWCALPSAQRAFQRKQSLKVDPAKAKLFENLSKTLGKDLDTRMLFFATVRLNEFNGLRGIKALSSRKLVSIGPEGYTFGDTKGSFTLSRRIDLFWGVGDSIYYVPYLIVRLAVKGEPAVVVRDCSRPIMMGDVLQP